MASRGNPFGNYELQTRLNFTCGKLALTLYPPNKTYARERFWTKSCAQHAILKLNQLFIGCGNALLQMTLGKRKAAL